MEDASLIDSSVRDAVISNVAYGRVDDVRAALDAGFPISAAKSDTGFTNESPSSTKPSCLATSPWRYWRWSGALTPTRAA